MRVETVRLVRVELSVSVFIRYIIGSFWFWGIGLCIRDLEYFRICFVRLVLNLI